MALGKNIKRDRLIPLAMEELEGEPTSKKTSKTEKKQSPKPGKVKYASANQQIPPSKTAATKKKSQTRKKTATLKWPIFHPKSLLSPAEIEAKRELKLKYDQEIKALQGQVLQLVKFDLGGDQYAIEINKIKEVAPTPPLSQIPHAPAYIKGIANIRGSMIVIMDLAEKFELIASDKTGVRDLNFTMVIDSPHIKIGILLGEVPVTLKVLGDIIESSAGLVSDTSLDETYIKGLIKLNGEVIIFIDIIDLIESSLARGNSKEKMNTLIEEETS